MLQIKNICKTYKTGDLIQNALDDVSLDFKDNEFVAILGPSGSGKTTFLNIIGGLDRYDSGDLIINGKSTKKYKDRDWDNYRNHTIGFVFQSYNLIPHQSVLKNVELALTIAGVSRSQRKQRALKALEEVGLKEQAHKKPNQMSGGQMQRVAIARALVNNPDILLADEPTGALDSKTSIQVMELLKKVAEDKLVIMVTHNAELAKDYASRIVQLKDGKITYDSNPYKIEKVEERKVKNKKKAKMGFLTALSLSLNNLLTKKARTFLTAFAGSIGIIGIALILSLSQGFQNYIDKIQEDTLTSYPLTISSDTADMTSAILSMVSDKENNKQDGNSVVERQYLTTMFSSIGSNDLKSFKQYLENHEDEYQDDVSDVKYSYSITPTIYTIDAADNLAKIYPSSLLSTMYSSSATSMLSSFSSASGGMIFSQMSTDEDVYDKYDVLAGRWPENYTELIIVLSEPNSISDLLVYSLGLKDTNELKDIITSIMANEEVDIDSEAMVFTYDDLLNLDLRLIKQSDTYKYNDRYDIYEDMSEDEDYMMDLYDKSLKLKVVGVVCAKDVNSSSNPLSPGVNYQEELIQKIIEDAYNSEIVQKQLSNKDIDVFSGDNFDEQDNEEEKLNFNDMISIDEDILKDAFKINISKDSLTIDSNAMAEAISEATVNACKNLNIDTSSASTSTTLIDETISLDMLNTYNSWIQISGNYNPEDLNDTLNRFKEYYYENSETYKNLMVSFTSIDNFEDNAKIVSSSLFYKILNDISNFTINVLPTIDSTNSLTIISGLSTYFNDALSDEAVSKAFNIQVAQVVKYSNAMVIGQYIGEAVSEVSSMLSESMSSLFSEDIMSIDTDKFAEAFNFDMDEDELSRIMSTMMSGSEEKSYKNNLINLGYQDEDDPTSISFYFKSFEAKENFLDFLDKYNNNLEEDEKIKYTDITGILMSSVKTIVDSVTYVLIAFVSISLIVSSIMIAVITLISVMERTKEIGILRAMGASKHNVSSIFNAETFIIGLLSGLIGIGFTYSVIPLINNLIHKLTNNYDINAVLPYKYATILVLISVVLTIFAGIIPSKKASKQDPVIALRSE